MKILFTIEIHSNDRITEVGLLNEITDDNVEPTTRLVPPDPLTHRRRALARESRFQRTA